MPTVDRRQLHLPPDTNRCTEVAIWEAVRRANGLELDLLVLACILRGATAESSFKEDRLSTLVAALALCTSDASCKEHRQV